MLDVSEIIDCPELQQTVEIIRNSGSGYGDDGRPTPGTNTIIQVKAVVTKATAAEVQTLEQGEVLGEVRRFITREETRASKEDSLADRMIWKNKN